MILYRGQVARERPGRGWQQAITGTYNFVHPKSNGSFLDVLTSRSQSQFRAPDNTMTTAMNSYGQCSPIYKAFPYGRKLILSMSWEHTRDHTCLSWSEILWCHEIQTQYKLPVTYVMVRRHPSTFLSNTALCWGDVFLPRLAWSYNQFLLPSLQHGWDGVSSAEFTGKVTHIPPFAAALKSTKTRPYMKSLDIVLILSHVINTVQSCNLTD